MVVQKGFRCYNNIMRYVILILTLAFTLTARADITARSWIVTDARGNIISEKERQRKLPFLF